MPQSKFGGFKDFRISPAGEATWTELGAAKSDSESNPEVPDDEETTTGDRLYAGTRTNETLRFHDLSNYDQVRNWMKDDQKVDLQGKDMDDNWVDIETDFIPRVRKPNQYQPGTRHFWELIVAKFNI